MLAKRQRLVVAVIIKQFDVTYLILLSYQELIERVENLEQEMEELQNEIKQRGTY